ncbi:MAG: leucine-rich repeat domain-containing protein, partial [Clostridiales bacterium]|nr:leucine-rich repeat domain-containing protein [Clostridiales bacterium]
EWKTEKEPTCVNKGTEARTCLCKYAEKKSIAALGHNFVDGKCIHCSNTQLKYTLSGDGTCYAVSGFNDGVEKKGSVEILSEINGLPVTSISKRAFDDCCDLKSVTIPDSITSIGYYAFADTGITSIIIPENITFIDEGAFDFSRVEIVYWNAINCTVGTIDYSIFRYSSLSTLVIGKNVTSIGGRVFFNCGGLKSVTISNSVTRIGWDAFRWCSGLTRIDFQGTKAQWEAIEKGADWDYETGDYTVYCTDGTIKKGE